MDIIGEAIASMRAGEPTSARCSLRAPWGMRFPALGGAGFHVILQGAAWMLPPGDADPIRLNVGDVVFVSHGRSHALVDDPKSPQFPMGGVAAEDIPDGDGPRTSMLCGSYYLNNIRPHPLIAALPEVIHLPAKVAPEPGVRSIVELLGAEMDERQPGTSAAVPALLDLLLLYIVRTWYHGKSGGWASALDDPAISAAIGRIQQEPQAQWTVAGLAEHVGLSRATFARRFAELVGEPPLSYLTWWRMTKAGQLLSRGDQPLAAIARQVGYQSEFAFSKAFKREFSLSPTDYRRQRRAGARMVDA
ncbi:AraC family transcriptional regulator [Kibdelosporangium aridum]|nr:AraC family transcriptional regulator [Kibdelosporangium aridum]